MCGFLALQMLRGAPVDPERVAAMRDTMLHRGPDDAGLRVDGSVALAHRRLSILDLSPLGHQPMSNEDGTVWIVFNGEIYNYVELAKELTARGHVMRSGSDTEVIVHLWEEMGPRCVERLNGMFAFVIWDANKRELFGARDRMGIKPFFYFLGADRFIAASEIKGILADTAVRRAPDLQGISDYLLTGFPMGDKTTFLGIRQLPPGWAMSLKDGELRTWQYWDLEFRPNHTRSATDTLAELTDLLDDAVAIHCRSDAPLGCHLSGGLDSSSVVAFARRHHDPLETFSIRFGGGAFFDESSHARAVARHLGTVHWEAQPAPGDLAALLASLAWHCDLPMPGHTIFAYHAASRLAAERVTVALTGHGGDEVFAGYPAQFQAAFGTTAMFDLSARPQARVSPWARLRTALRRDGIAGVARRVLSRGAVETEPTDLKSLWYALHCGRPPIDSPILTAEFRRQLSGYNSKDTYLAPLDAVKSGDTLDQCLYHDLRAYLPALLHQEDRASMAVSIESRVPLLDYRLVEYLATVPTDIKVPDRLPKGLLRKAVEPMLPREVVYRRDKGAFGVPTGEWFKGPLRGLVRDVVLSERAFARGVFDPRELADPSVGATALWGAMSLELWFRIHIDQDRELLSQIHTASAAPESPIGVRVKV